MKGREVSFLIVAMILGAIVGGLVGELIGAVLPPGAAKTLFEKSIEVGFPAVNVQLYAISFTLGLMVKINFVSVLVIIGVLVYFRWWYL